jgi:DNA-binding MarR family transcriptional regulator
VQQADIERLAGGPPRLAYEDIVSHPRLAEARAVHLDRFLALYDGDPFTVRLLIESGRFLVYHVAGMLDASADPARRETWLTTKRLKQEMKLFGLASDRHIDGLIARLCSTGFMERKPAEQDRRVRILQPTEKLRQHDRDWLAAHIAPLAVLYPEHGYGPILAHDRQFHAQYRRISMSFLPLGAALLLSLPDTMLFFNHAAGAVLQAALLRAAMAAPDYPNATVSYVEIGERLGVSRTHVRELLGSAEAAGLVRLHARGGRGIEILPRHWLSYDRGLAAGMYVHDLVYLATERAARQQVSQLRQTCRGSQLG